MSLRTIKREEVYTISALDISNSPHCIILDGPYVLVQQRVGEVPPGKYLQIAFDPARQVSRLLAVR